MTTGNIPISVDLSTVESASDAPLYPVGEYLLKTVGIDSGVTDKGIMRLSVRSEIQGGPGLSQEHNGKTVFDNFNLDSKGFPFLKRFLEACGIPAQEMQQWFTSGMGIPPARLENLTCCAINSHREWNGTKYNNWGRYAPASMFNQPKNQGGAQQQAQAPGQAAQPGFLQPPASAPPPPQQGMMPPQGAPQGYPPQGTPPQGMPPQQGYPQQGAPQAPQQGYPQQGAQQPGFPSAPPPPGQVPGQS